MKVIGWQLVRLAREAQALLVGCQIEQIRRRPDRARIGLVAGSSRGKFHIVVGIRGEAAALYWSQTKSRIADWELYERTEAFNRLRSARLTAVGIAANDRILRFEFDKPGEAPEEDRRYSLVAAWTGSVANLWLIDPTDETILESLHPDTEAEDRGRRRALSLPAPPDLADWRTLTRTDYKKLRQSDQTLDLGDFLRRRFWGIDSGLARQIEERVGAISQSEMAGEHSALRDWEEFQALQEVTGAAIDPSTPLSLTGVGNDPSDIRLAGDDPAGTTSLAELLVACDRARAAEAPGSGPVAHIAGALRDLLRKNERRLASLARTEAEGARADEYKRLADLLSAHRADLRKGMAGIDVPDWQGGSKITIPLNAARSPQQNIEDYYRKARKAADAVAAARNERPHLARDLERLRAALARIDAGLVEGEALREIAVAFGIDPEAPPVGRRPAPRLPYREFVIGRDRLLVGRSSRDNDELTLRHARPQDLFFHVHGSPGSHVILRRENRDTPVDKDTITLAAQVAAYFSKSKHAGLVPVVYTEARYVRKPRKAPAGTVSVEREKTIMVRPLPPPGYHDKKTPD
jgi:predicted ribosome quality control (RQC) complex YloA/Tae2 family protein